MKKIKINNSDIIYGLLFFGGLILQIVAIDLFRLTFIPTVISVGLYLGSGCIGFLVFRKKLIDRQNSNWLRVIASFIWCIVSIGGILTFLFLGVNYYLASHSSTLQSFSILNTGIMGGRFSGVEFYAVVEKESLKKEIVFNCGHHGLLAGNKKIGLTISEGALGFDIIRNKSLEK